MGIEHCSKEILFGSIENGEGENKKESNREMHSGEYRILQRKRVAVHNPA